MKPFTAWIARSRYGHPAPVAGWAFTRKTLIAEYNFGFGRDFQADGYKAVKVKISMVVREVRSR